MRWGFIFTLCGFPAFPAVGWRIALPIVYLGHFCQKSIDHRYVGLWLGSLSCFLSDCTQTTFDLLVISFHISYWPPSIRTNRHAEFPVTICFLEWQCNSEVCSIYLNMHTHSLDLPVCASVLSSCGVRLYRSQSSSSAKIKTHHTFSIRGTGPSASWDTRYI